VHGDLTPEGRDAQASTFRDCAAPAVFIATIDSVTMAISLVGADLVLFGDLVPEPWKHLQFEKRFHRHGSTKRVLVRYLIGAGTIDEGVAETVIEKLSTIEEALGQDEGQSDLRGLLGGGQRQAADRQRLGLHPGHAHGAPLLRRRRPSAGRWTRRDHRAPGSIQEIGGSARAGLRGLSLRAICR
jgi:hypothetical protein